MAADMAIELRKKNICVVSLWPGAVVTELVADVIKQGQKVLHALSLTNYFQEINTLKSQGNLFDKVI